MRGAITSKDVLLHSVAIVRLWGVRTYLHCLWAAMTRRRTTFLGVLYPDGRRARWTPSAERRRSTDESAPSVAAPTARC